MPRWRQSAVPTPSTTPPVQAHTRGAVGLEEGEAAGVAQVVAATLGEQEVVVGARQRLPGHQVQVALGDWEGGEGKEEGEGGGGTEK
jgi:hypothetical protein